MQVGAAGIPHVGYGKHQVGEYRYFGKSIYPIALVLLGVQVLQFDTGCDFAAYLVLAVEYDDVGVYHTAFAFDNALVVLLEHVHGVELEVFGELLVYLQSGTGYAPDNL